MKQQIKAERANFKEKRNKLRPVLGSGFGLVPATGGPRRVPIRMASKIASYSLWSGAKMLSIAEQDKLLADEVAHKCEQAYRQANNIPEPETPKAEKPVKVEWEKGLKNMKWNCPQGRGLEVSKHGYL